MPAKRMRSGLPNKDNAPVYQAYCDKTTDPPSPEMRPVQHGLAQAQAGPAAIMAIRNGVQLTLYFRRRWSAGLPINIAAAITQQMFHHAGNIVGLGRCRHCARATSADQVLISAVNMPGR
jgi:hypothetical protein